MTNRKPLPPSRSGIVLLIVLGMLSLFTVLVVSFVVFSSQMVASSSANARRQQDEVSPEPPLEAAISQILAGTNDHHSAAFRNSMLEDFYGNDGNLLRVGHQRPTSPATLALFPEPVGQLPGIRGGQLMLPLDARGEPVSTMFRFPSPFVRWNANGDIANLPPNTTSPFQTIPDELRVHLDDAFAGRVLAFEEGPLKDQVFRVIRYFGNVNGTQDRGATVVNQTEYSLAGNFVIDLAEVDGEVISIDGVPERLYEVAANFPNRLLYDPGPDGQPGVANADDDGNSIVDDASELGLPGTDDYGYRFILNGGIFNGRGVNPGGLTGLVRNERPENPVTLSAVDPTASIELTLNSRLSGPAYFGGRLNTATFPATPIGVELPEFDEAWDAADTENLFLAFQPSDHRRAIPQTIYTGAGSTELNRQLGQMIIPSFHRPSVINFLMNAPIRLPGDVLDPAVSGYFERTFWDIRNNPQTASPFFDNERIRVLAFQIRRATIRPLNFSHSFVNAVESDLDKDGNPFDGAPGFSGSNPTGILNQAIDFGSTPATLGNRILALENLAIWLVNGPWDVDNDGDGLPESVWVDFNLPVVTAPDGKLIKPLVAPLIEDMDGRINVNVAGSYQQLNHERFISRGGQRSEPIQSVQTWQRDYTNDSEWSRAFATLRNFGHGGGVGPAEIDFSHLFAFDRPTGVGLGPLATRQYEISQNLLGNGVSRVSIDDVLRTRYGNLLNVRYGGTVYDYSSNYPYSRPVATTPYYPSVTLQQPYFAVGSQADFLKFPGSGTRFSPSSTADVLARIPMRGRNFQYHNTGSLLGRPLDVAGVMQVLRLDPNGRHVLTDLAKPYQVPQTPAYTGTGPIASRPAGRGLYNEFVNHPYEFASDQPLGDDSPFTVSEYIDLLRGGPLNGRLSQLLSDAANQNEALERLITVESRAVELPELPGVPSVVHLFGEKWDRRAFDPPGATPLLEVEAQSIQLQRMLSLELRKGSKLNLNRALGDMFNNSNVAVDTAIDDIAETDSKQRRAQGFNATPPAGRPFEERGLANNRNASRRVDDTVGYGDLAFPVVDSTSVGFVPPTTQPPMTQVFNTQGAAAPSYQSSSIGPDRPAVFTDPTGHLLDFDGIDINGNGVFEPTLGEGTQFDFDGDGTVDGVAKMADGAELLARHLYCLMFALIEDRNSQGELVPNFPYPNGFVGRGNAAEIEIRNRYVAKRLAQWAVNAVDYRDADARCTRLRYDWNPFDADGFSLQIAAQNTVWGMERPELELTETLAYHNKRMKRNLLKEHPPADMSISLDGELQDDEDPSESGITDSDMDQFGIPQAGAMVEIRSLASPVEDTGVRYTNEFRSGNPADFAAGVGETQAHLSADLYSGNQLDLARTVGTGVQQSPVWRLAVGEPTRGDPHKSTRALFDADRLAELSADATLQTASATHFGQPNYLSDNFDFANGEQPVDWSGGTPSMDDDLDDLLDRWREMIFPFASVAPSPAIPGDSSRTEHVTLGDTFTISPGGGGVPATLAKTNRGRLRLTRFAWFANMSPSNQNVVTNPQSGMREDNVFFNRQFIGSAGSTLPLAPGQYAVVAPRALVHFGQKRASNDADAANLYPYFPSDQKFEVTATPGGYRVDYYEADRTTPQMPEYVGSDATNPNAGDILPILPIFCESLRPHEVIDLKFPTDTMRDTYVPGWRDYFTNTVAGSQIDMGFNISAPLPGVGYYEVPDARIRAAYPFLDGYRDYDALDPTDFHPDTPLDHQVGQTIPTAPAIVVPDPPLSENGFEWAAVGTHEEAVTIFLQRLADPSTPWDPIDNPYVTVDFLPMDLTTFNGEEDVRTQIIPVEADGGGGFIAGTPRTVDNHSFWDTTDNEFVPLVRFDSRRKIPDWRADRGSSIVTGGAKEIVAKRPAYSVATNVLRPDDVDPSLVDHWPFELGSVWNDGSYPVTDPFDTSFNTNLASLRDYDSATEPFGQTFGYVNREVGQPIRRGPADPIGVRAGEPRNVFYQSIPWMDRDFQSPYDLMAVPAVSRTGLLANFSTGTDFHRAADGDPTNLEREFITPFSHVLGFEQGLGRPRLEDMSLESGARARRPLGMVEDADGTPDMYTGDRPGFEQIFDFVDTGPVWFDSQRWIDPTSVQFIPESVINPLPGSTLPSLGINQQLRFRMYNRVVETLQPPYNYVGKHRTPGKINLNTMPDYIRKAPLFGSARNSPDSMLDGETDITSGVTYFEDPSSPAALPSNPRLLGYNPTNAVLDGNGLPTNQPLDANGFTNEFNTSELFGNGSVYRSLSQASSTFYDLDFVRGEPSTTGDYNIYNRTVDSPFGHNFKAFIESRRGHSTTLRGNRGYLGNPELDWRYPTRFAGMFAPARASATPTVQRFMRQLNVENGAEVAGVANPVTAFSNANQPVGFPRRSHDMSLLRLHPDFDKRTMTVAEQVGQTTEVNTEFSLTVEADSSTSPFNDPNEGGPSDYSGPQLSAADASFGGLRMPLTNTGLFDRSQAELHMNGRNFDRDPYFRHKGAARLANKATHHSNVFLVRMTVGYFIVDPTTGAVGAEYVNETGDVDRSRGTYLIDRTIPVGYLQGHTTNADRTILYSEVEE